MIGQRRYPAQTIGRYASPTVCIRGDGNAAAQLIGSAGQFSVGGMSVGSNVGQCIGHRSKADRQQEQNGGPSLEGSPAQEPGEETDGASDDR